MHYHIIDWDTFIFILKYVNNYIVVSEVDVEEEWNPIYGSRI